MAHGTPLGVAENNERYGAEGAFLIEAGISSSYHIARFFGLTEWINQSQAAQKSHLGAPSSAPSPVLTDALRPLTTIHRRPERRQMPRRRGIDVGSVITRALTAAGLMNSGRSGDGT
jgi:hypothetical protein